MEQLVVPLVLAAFVGNYSYPVVASELLVVVQLFVVVLPAAVVEEGVVVVAIVVALAVEVVEAAPVFVAVLVEQRRPVASYAASPPVDSAE